MCNMDMKNLLTTYLLVLIYLCIDDLGRRSCIGEHLAKMEIFVFFSYFMHRFEFKTPDNSPPLNLKARPGLTHSPFPFDTCAIKRD